MLANVAMVILDTLPVHPSQELRLLRTSNQNSGTETKELHSALHPPVRDVSERERERERQKSCTANIHPPVTISFGAEPLVSSRHCRRQLCFQVVGALIGFKYRT
jgi:hypothetical protein